MSDAAISSQIAPQASSSNMGEKSSSSLENSTTKTQASEFDEVLDEKTAQLKNTDSSQQTGLLTPLLTTEPLLSKQTPLSISSGKALPKTIPVTSFEELLLINLPPNSGKQSPLVAQTKPMLEELNSTINPDANRVLAAGDIPIEEDFLSKQLKISLLDKDTANGKPLNAQLFTQLINQSANQPQASVDNSILPGSSSLIVTQSMTSHSNSATLPAISVSPEHAQFNQQVGERINWMVNNNMQRADIRLDPPELGNLDIRLNMGKDNQASILIHVTNPSAKEAIESAIPRLREMFEQQGLDLANVDVSQQNSQQQQNPFEQFEENDFAHNGSNILNQSNNLDAVEQGEISAVSYLNSRSSNNLLDLFA